MDVDYCCAKVFLQSKDTFCGSYTIMIIDLGITEYITDCVGTTLMAAWKPFSHLLNVFLTYNRRVNDTSQKPRRHLLYKQQNSKW